MSGLYADSFSAVQFARALADPTRQSLMQLIKDEWRSVGEIADFLAIRQPSASHHIAILRDAGLLQRQVKGRKTFYRLDQDQIAVGCGTLILQFAPAAMQKE